MDLLLSILKFSGIIVSGALGILGTVTDTRNKRTGRLNLWGKWALGLTIAGFATALLSEIAQQCKEHQDILDTQARIERQIAVQKVTLNRVERILTRFDTISFSVRYELGTNNGFIKSLHDYAADRIPTALREKSFFLGSPTNMGGPTNMAVFSDVVIGWDYGKTFSIRDNGDSAQISLPSNKALQRYLDDSVLAQDFNRFYSFLKNPRFAFAVYAPNRDCWQIPDLYLTTTNLNMSPALGFDFSSGKPFIEWSFDCPKSNWKQSKRMTSLPDLANAQLYLSSIDAPSTISSSLIPLSAEVTFDLTKLKIRNFSRAFVPPENPTDLRVLTGPSGASQQESTTDISSKDPNSRLSEFGEFKVSRGNLFSALFPDEETILNSQ